MRKSLRNLGAYLCLLAFGGTLAAFAQSKSADMEAAYAKLKEAEGKKDPDGVLEFSEKTSALARAILETPKPSGTEEADQWKRETDYARQIDLYTEYSEFALAVQGQPPAKVIALVESIEKRSPKSQYLTQAYPFYLVALNSSGQNAKIVPAVEKRLPNDPTNEDLLLVLADSYMSQKQGDKATEYALKLVDAVKSKAKPEGMADADWEKKKSNALARGYWISGINQADAKKFKEADESLRAALPLIQGQADLLGPALFYLGVANYQLAKPAKDKKIAAEAIKFSDQAAAIKSPFQSAALKNARAIRLEFGIK